MDFLLFKGIKVPFNHLLIQHRELNILSSTLKNRNDHKVICNLEIFCPLLEQASLIFLKKALARDEVSKFGLGQNQ